MKGIKRYTSGYKINKSWESNVHIGNLVNKLVTTLHVTDGFIMVIVS